MAKRKKKPELRVVMTVGKRSIIQYVLKDLLGGIIKGMMEAEMNEHLGYSKSDRYESDDYRNGYKSKVVNSSYGHVNIEGT